MNAGIAADLLEDLTAVVSISSIHHVVRCLGTAEMRGPICQDLWARDIMLSKHYQCSSTNLSPTSLFDVSIRIEILFEIEHPRSLAVLLVPRLPRLDLAFLAAIPLGLAFRTLLEFLASLCFLLAVVATTLSNTLPLVQLLQCTTVSQVT